VHRLSPAEAAAGEDILERAVLVALRHFGLPYELVDMDGELSDARFEELVSRRPALLFPRSGSCARLSAARADRLAQAVSEGLGLVLYEPDLASLPSAICGLFASSLEGERGELRELVVARDDAYATWLKEVGETVRSDAGVDFTALHAGEGSALTDGSGHDLMLLAERGEGRALLFPFDASLYCIEAVGHAAGLDDLFTRSIVWAARPPFAVWGMPPMAGLAVDDCSGSYNFFGYVDVMNERGWKPSLSLFTETIDEVAHDDVEICARRLRRGAKEGGLEVNFHALRYNESFCFDHLGRRSLALTELEDRFARYDAARSRLGVEPSPWAHPHFGEIGAAAIPFYQARGVEFITYLLPLDAAWFDVPSKIAPLPPLPPFGHGGYYQTELPGFPGVTACNCVLDKKTRQSADYVPKTDYLWNNTVFWNENEGIDVGRAARTLAEQIKRGVDSGFYGEGATHEQRIACLRPGELAEIYAEADRLLSRHRIDWRRLGSEVMPYARKRRLSSIVRLDREGEGIAYEFSSDEAVGTEFQVYERGSDGWPCARRVSVRTRQGRIEG
jgi:hypothetical protein